MSVLPLAVMESMIAVPLAPSDSPLTEIEKASLEGILAELMGSSKVKVMTCPSMEVEEVVREGAVVSTGV